MNWAAFVLGLVGIVADKLVAAFGSKAPPAPPAPPPREPGFDAVDAEIDRKLAGEREP